MKRILTILACAMAVAACKPATEILIEAESFSEKGGWVLDNQSMTQMGSPYLLAHGMGIPVKDAESTFKAGKDGDYRVWVRTRDWIKSFGKAGSPGQFKLVINGSELAPTFGTESLEWDWQDGGVVSLKKGTNSIALHDLTGFEGRCDAIYLTQDLEAGAPVNDLSALNSLRRELLGIDRIEDAGTYDFVVVGGGVGGMCAAVSAARLGCKVALIQNRPLLGGNNSSEIRVGMTGYVCCPPYPMLGALMDELGGVGDFVLMEAKREGNVERFNTIKAILDKHPEKLQSNAGPACNYEDDKKLNFIKSEKNIDLFLNTQAIDVQMDGDKIKAVICKDIETGKEMKFKSALFADCTGDGNLGFMAGADYRMGREGKEETGESLAPDQADDLTMGASVMWYALQKDSPSTFPECPWAIQFNDETCLALLRGNWDWESGLNNDQITEIEYIRDHALRAVYGNWSYLKNHYIHKDEYADKALEWVSYIGGKRESRRLMGDIIVKEQDIKEQVAYDDACVVTNWGMDLHYPKPIPGVDDEPFLAISISAGHKDYLLPYRCLYSRNIGNLLMAGRDISVTHAALGTVRVSRTIGVMGEVIGTAASICKKYGTSPRGVYEEHLPEFKELLVKGTGHRGFTVE